MNLLTQLSPDGFLRRVMPTVAVLIATTCLTSHQYALANPSSKRPQQPLASHGTIAQAKELTNKLYGLYQKHEAAAIDLYARSDNPSRLPYRQMSNAAGELFIAIRDSQHLRLMGEPASVELDRGLRMVNFEMLKLMGKYRSTTPGGAQVQKNKMQLQRISVRNNKTLDKIADAIKNNQLEQAEKQLEKMGQELEELLFILTPKEREPFSKKFYAAISALDSKYAPVRRQQYFDEAKQAAASELQKINDFAGEARRIPAEIAANGKAAGPDSDELDASEAIRYLGDQWGKASAALIRYNAIQWAFSRSEPSSINQSTMQRVSQLATGAKDAVIAVIDAAAVSTPAEEVPAAYSRVLGQLSYLDRRMVGSGISKDCEPSLQRFAAKSPGFPEVIKSYERATKQALIWRSRFASSHATTLAGGYPDALSTLSQEFQVTKPSQPKIYRPAGTRKKRLITKDFAGSAAWKVADASPFFVGMRVSEGKMLRLYEGSLTGIVRHQNTHYANVAVGMPIQRELNDLKICLLVNDDHAPLSIQAADAISSAQEQDFLRVGGAIRQLHLEAAVTRFASLPDIANQVAPLERLPSIDDQMDALEQACWRLDIEPHWIRHQYFTVAIKSKLPK